MCPTLITPTWSPNRKITRLSGQAAAPGAASAGPVKVAWWSGCLGEGDGVAEGFELAEVVGGLALLVDAANRKITRLSGQAAAPGAASAGPVKVAWWSGCLGEGDGVAEGFELADVVAG